MVRSQSIKTWQY